MVRFVPWFRRFDPLLQSKMIYIFCPSLLQVLIYKDTPSCPSRNLPFHQGSETYKLIHTSVDQSTLSSLGFHLYDQSLSTQVLLLFKLRNPSLKVTKQVIVLYGYTFRFCVYVPLFCPRDVNIYLHNLGECFLKCKVKNGNGEHYQLMYS